MTEYNKLVRDGILEIIKASGGVPHSHTISGEQLLKALFDKLEEERLGLVDNPSLEELGDVLEVVRKIGSLIGGYTISDIERENQREFVERGGFDKGIFLESVEESNVGSTE